MVDFTLPDIGEGMAEAEIVTWLVAVGDAVTEGTPLLEISTDKIVVELPAPCDGWITDLRWQAGDVVKVGQVLLTLSRELSPEHHDGLGAKILSALDPDLSRKLESSSSITRPDSPTAAATVAPVDQPYLVASPSTRKFAADNGINLASINGTGPDGRVLRSDLTVAMDALQAQLSPDSVAETPSITDIFGGEQTVREPLRGIRAVAADRLALSASTYATATSTIEVRGDLLLELAKYTGLAGNAGSRVGVLPFVITSVAAALTRHPRFNATIDEEGRALLMHRAVNIGVAMATPRGLVVPVIKSAEMLRPSAIGKLVADLGTRAKEGRLAAADTSNATFTVSSTGSLERGTLVSTTPIVNPPQVAILWVSRIIDRPRCTEGLLEVGPMMICSLSFDHRFVDGAEVTGFLNDLDAFLTHPERALM